MYIRNCQIHLCPLLLIYHCHDLKIPFQNSYAEIPIPMKVLGSSVFGKWLSHKGGVLMNGISTVMDETKEIPLNLCTKWGNREKTAIYEPRSRPLPNIESASVFMLDFTVSRNVSNKLQLLIRLINNVLL
jgi:hypothetical protein